LEERAARPTNHSGFPPTGTLPTQKSGATSIDCRNWPLLTPHCKSPPRTCRGDGSKGADARAPPHMPHRRIFDLLPVVDLTDNNSHHGDGDTKDPRKRNRTPSARSFTRDDHRRVLGWIMSADGKGEAEVHIYLPLLIAVADGRGELALQRPS
jgi:hypothetical protein